MPKGKWNEEKSKTNKCCHSPLEAYNKNNNNNYYYYYYKACLLAYVNSWETLDRK